MSTSFIGTILNFDDENVRDFCFNMDAIQFSCANTPTLYCHFDPPKNWQLDLSKVAAIASNIRIDNNKIIADFKMLNTPYGKILDDMRNSNTELRYNVWGQMNIDLHSRIVTGFHFAGISILPL